MHYFSHLGIIHSCAFHWLFSFLALISHPIFTATSIMCWSLTHEQDFFLVETRLPNRANVGFVFYSSICNGET